MCGRATAPMCWPVTIGVGSKLMTVCMTMLGPPTGFLVTSCGVDMGPLTMVMPENGSGLAPAMGLDGAVWRSGSD